MLTKHAWCLCNIQYIQYIRRMFSLEKLTDLFSKRKTTVKMLKIWSSIFMQILMTIPVFCVLPDDYRDTLIRAYFRQGFTWKEICGFLLILHNISVSIHQMKRIVKRLQLRRRNSSSPPLDIISAVSAIYRRGFFNSGYRTIWNVLRTQTNVVATQEQIRVLLKVFDPEGVELRSRHRLRRRTYFNKGPNYLIHIDGYDKLKPFGIAIHGGIDGHSRRILWLEASSSNNDPKIVGRYYIDFLKKLGRVPRCVRSDAGTENVIVRDLQTALRFEHNDPMSGLRSYIQGRSTGNQRIEQFWGTMKHIFTVFWRNLFRDLRDSGKLCIEDPIHIECLRFSFMRIIQHDLDTFARTWNLHRIRKQRNSEVPNGIPNVLYFQPESTGAIDYSFSIPCSLQCLNHVGSMYTVSKPRYGCDELFLRVLTEMSGLEPEQLPIPFTVENSVALFCTLTEMVCQY